MPKEEKSQIIQLDEEFDILQGIKKEEKKEKPKKKIDIYIDKFVHFINKYKKTTIILALLLGIGIVAFIFVVAHLFNKEDVITQQAPPPPIFQLEKGTEIANAQDLEALLKKANFLYTHGNKKEALALFEKIANYSEGLSSYNLGVAQMNEKSYEAAIASFQRAIDLGEDRVISALNAAISALNLGKLMPFQYYLNLANAYLPYSGNLPLYSYLYGLIKYYQGHYIEALSPLLHADASLYEKDKNRLLASLYASFNQNRQAIEYLNKDSSPKNWFNLGILYARIGEYQEADHFISQSIQANGENLQNNMALALVKLKRAQFESAGQILNKYAQNPDEIDKNPYPIIASVKDKFFDVNLAQKRFWNHFRGQKLNAYKILFYYAPYKVFDAKEAFSVIQEGGLNIQIQNIQEAKDILLRSQTISRVNKNIAQAILESLNGNIRKANTLLKEAIQNYPTHSILHYNLGLNFAQLGNYDEAYQHFIRSFRLNPKDLYAASFAIMTAQLTYRDYQRLNADIGESLVDLANDEEGQFINALLGFIRDASPSIDWIDSKKSNIALHLALSYVASAALDDQKRLIKAAKELQNHLPTDPIANLLQLLAINFKDDPKTLSLKLQSFYQDPNINKNPIYYGPAIARELYIEIAHIIGTLHYVKDDLDYRLITEQNDARGVAQALALTNIYLQEFEKAFTLYNSLIDDLKENDTQTLFLASVAAIGSGHTENAAVLLQLSKLEAPTNYETRIAIGLLYQQEKNFAAAASQFLTIGNNIPQSEYFDFKIDASPYLLGDTTAREAN